MAAAKKTITVTQISGSTGKQRGMQETLIVGLGLGPFAQHARAGRHACRTRHDYQGAPFGARR